MTAERLIADQGRDTMFLTPFALRDLRLPNRIVMSPMAMYAADEGEVNHFHLTHYHKVAMGGVGMVIVEQTAVSRRGRITNGCLGLWHDGQIEGCASSSTVSTRSVRRRRSRSITAVARPVAQRAWQGNGPLTAEDVAHGEESWVPEGPSTLPFAEGWPEPDAMSIEAITKLRADFLATAHRALAAGFDMIELHLAHGTCCRVSFTPIANRRRIATAGRWRTACVCLWKSPPISGRLCHVACRTSRASRPPTGSKAAGRWRTALPSPER